MSSLERTKWGQGSSDDNSRKKLPLDIRGQLAALRTTAIQNRSRPPLCKGISVWGLQQQKKHFLPRNTGFHSKSLTARTLLLPRPLVPANSSAWHAQALKIWSPQDLRMQKHPCPQIWKPLDLLYMEVFRACGSIRTSAMTHRQALPIFIVCISLSHWEWPKESKFA